MKKVASLVNDIESSGRVSTISFRVTKDEKQAIKVRAKRSMLSVSRYILTCTLLKNKGQTEELQVILNKTAKLRELFHKIRLEMKKSGVQPSTLQDIIDIQSEIKTILEQIVKKTA